MPRVRMNQAFRVHWLAEGMPDALAAVVLRPPLRRLIEAPFVRIDGTLVLEPLDKGGPAPDLLEMLQDRTGYEAFANKLHVDDWLDDVDTKSKTCLHELIRQGIKAAVILSERLEREGRYRVVLGLQPEWPTMDLRFFERREGEPWGPESPDGFEDGGVLYIDAGD